MNNSVCTRGSSKMPLCHYYLRIEIMFKLLSSMGCECDCESYIICVLYVALFPGPISQLSLLHTEMVRKLGDKGLLCELPCNISILRVNFL